MARLVEMNTSIRTFYKLYFKGYPLQSNNGIIILSGPIYDWAFELTADRFRYVNFTLKSSIQAYLYSNA